MPCFPAHRAAEHGEIGMRQHRQRDVAMPAGSRNAPRTGPTRPRLLWLQKHASMVHLVPATRTRSDKSAASGASIRWKVHPSGWAGLRRISSPFCQPSGASNQPQGRWTQSYSRGPLAPSPARSRCQALAGISSSHCATVLNPRRCGWSPPGHNRDRPSRCSGAAHNPPHRHCRQSPSGRAHRCRRGGGGIGGGVVSGLFNEP